jgi:hypothetical protein
VHRRETRKNRGAWPSGRRARVGERRDARGSASSNLVHRLARRSGRRARSSGRRAPSAAGPGWGVAGRWRDSSTLAAVS